jgi:Tol biopolymer transport system component
VKGVPLSDPVQLTSGPALDTNPTWLNNSKTIVFYSLNGNDYDLWKIPAKGGAPVWLAGLPGSGDYDPEVSNNGKFLAWAGPQVP